MTGVRLADMALVVPRLVPSVVQVEEFLAFLLVAAALSVIGAALRALAQDGRDDLAEADLLVGWSAVAALFVAVGSFTAIPFTAIAFAVAAASIASFGLLRAKNRTMFAPGTMKIFLLLLPVLLLTLSQTASENDDLSQWLPNLRYLLIVDHFPGPGRLLSDSVFPAYPYAIAFVGYLTGKMTGTIPVTAVDRFNLLLLGSLALTVLRVFNGKELPARIGWRAAALALAGVTALNPTFVVRLVLSNYADCATAVILAFTAVLMVRVCEADRPPSKALHLQTLFAIAALALVKQANLVLLAASLGGLLLVWLKNPVRLLRLAPALIGGGLVYLAWRHQVSVIGSGEMPISAFANWQWDVLPTTFSNMLKVVSNKGGYFGLAVALSAVALYQRQSSPPLVLVFVAAFWGFTLFLSWVYLAVYIGYEGRSAASFWRYHTQLGGLQIAAAASLAGLAYRNSIGDRFKVFFSGLGMFVLAALVVVPVFAAPNIRFDINPSKDHVRDAVIAMSGQIPKDAKLLVADQKGSGFFTNFVRWHLGFQAPVADGTSVFTPDAQLPDVFSRQAFSHVYVISSSPALESILKVQPPSGGTSLFERTADGEWMQKGFWPFVGFDSIDAYKY